jgi:competence protein ComEA
LNLALTPSTPFKKDQYRELEQQYNKRTAAIEAKEKKLMQQYFAEAKSEGYIAANDTLPADSSSYEKEETSTQGTLKERLNINSATQKVLETLPGIGPTYARRIIEYREENNGFSSIEELKKIKGIAEKRLEKLKPFIKLKDAE